MNARPYLEQICQIDAKLKAIEANITHIRSEIRSLGEVTLSSSWPDGQPHGTKTTDPTGSTAIKMAERYKHKRAELADRLARYEYDQILTRSELWSKRMDIIGTLSKVQDPVSYQLLTMRYVDLKSWEYIAVEMNYTYNWLSGPLHRKALGLLQEVLDARL